MNHERLEVRRWYRIESIEDGRRVIRTRTATSSYPTLEEAQRGYDAALRGRWAPTDAVEHGVDAIGWRPIGHRVGVPMAVAIEHLRARGEHAIADRLARYLRTAADVT